MNTVLQPGATAGEIVGDWLLPFALWLLVLANIFDMGGVFGAKYVSYLVAAAVLALRWRVCEVNPGELAAALGLFVVWPCIAVVIGIAAGAEPRDAIGELTPFLPGILAFLLVRGTPPGRPLSILMIGLLWLAVISSLFFAVLLLAPGSAPASLILTLFADEGHGYFGVRQLGPVSVPNVYFKATLFMVPAFAWFLFRRRYMAAALCGAGLVLTFSRAGVALAALLLMAYLFQGSIRQKVAAVVAVGAIGLLLATQADLLQVSEYLVRMQDALLGRDQSAQARLGHLDSVLQLLGRDAVALWFGQGAGTSFYSTGSGAWTTFIELDHLDAVRQFGLAWFVAFAAVVVAVVFRAFTHSPDGKAAAAALLVAFVASGTNPVLINPLFMIMLVMVAHLAGTRAPGRHERA